MDHIILEHSSEFWTKPLETQDAHCIHEDVHDTDEFFRRRNTLYGHRFVDDWRSHPYVLDHTFGKAFQ